MGAAATNCHCSHAIDSFLLRSLFTAPFNMSCCLFISSAILTPLGHCHRQHAHHHTYHTTTKQHFLILHLSSHKLTGSCRWHGSSSHKLPLLPCHRQLPVAQPLQCTTQHELLTSHGPYHILPLLSCHPQKFNLSTECEVAFKPRN